MVRPEVEVVSQWGGWRGGVGGREVFSALWLVEYVGGHERVDAMMVGDRGGACVCLPLVVYERVSL